MARPAMVTSGSFRDETAIVNAEEQRLCERGAILCVTQALEVKRGEMEVVTAVRRGLLQRLGRERYDLWFGAQIQFDWSSDQLTISAPDQFHLDRLKLRFRGDLEELCSAATGAAVHLKFQLDSSLRSPSSGVADSDREISVVGPGRGTSSEASPVEAVRANSQDVCRARPAISNEDEATARARENAGRANGRTVRYRSSANFETSPPRRRFSEFSSFVVGDSNRVAATAAKMAVQRLGSMSPLFLHGPTGCGKTHLLEAILTHARRSGAVKRSVLLSAEQFTGQFLEALQGSGLPNFRRKYRDLDLLLIDDVQFFAGKKATLVELQHTLDTLLRSGRQVVLAADRTPSALTGLGTDLMARMAGGLVCQVELPEYETRREVVRRLVATRSISVPDDVIDLVAQRIEGDARQLMGAVNRLEAVSTALQCELTMEAATEVLSDIFHATQRVVRLGDVERVVCDVFGLDPKTLQESGKSKEVNQPRMLAMWLARKYTRAAFSEIGRYFGRRSHSSVIAAHKRVAGWMAERTAIRVAHRDLPIDDLVKRIESRLRTG